MQSSDGKSFEYSKEQSLESVSTIQEKVIYTKISPLSERILHDFFILLVNNISIFFILVYVFYSVTYLHKIAVLIIRAI